MYDEASFARNRLFTVATGFESFSYKQIVMVGRGEGRAIPKAR
jgi:hypothetical protein